MQNRRTFLSSLAGLAGAGLLSRAWALDLSPAGQLHVASNQYPWFTFYQRRGRSWTENLEASLKEFSQSGIAGYEPSVNNVEEVKALAPLLKKNRLEMRSIYINSTLHAPDQAAQSVEQAIAIAKAAQPLGVKIMVTNPSPIKWGGPEDKNDEQLKVQAETLNRLGAELRKLGITLAYHTHDSEMRHAAREFHHMMQATDPQNVSFCLDAHWVYRGAGNSQVALFDVLRLYGNRITELHLRQSKNGVWTEVFGEGDIDYRRLARELAAMGVRPHVVLEQAVEKGSPDTLTALEAHRKSLAYTREVFAGLAG
jgi:inosose dehydratase